MPTKSIIIKETGKVVDFGAEDLPILIHGAAHAGASLFSVTVIANFFLRGRKILFFTAYPMAREEFDEQIKGSGKENDIFYLENFADISRGSGYQAVIVKSGDSELCLQAIQTLSDVAERIIFVKNIESILTNELFDEVKKYQKIIFSGDLDQVNFKSKIADIHFPTKILFSVSEINLGVSLPELEKYTGFINGREQGLITVRVS